MTRINTNLSSLIAQKTLQRSNQQLQESLTRLSTGLRINVGKDDPAGLIASEALRSDITNVRKAITNSERANQLIATADSALGQVSSLLNDIRGLVSEAANTGALSDDQISANQLQIDSSLEAIDRISQITSFQGRRLLDGNLDFITTGVNGKIQDLQIDQANFGTLSQIAVGVDVVKQATRGQLSFNAETITEDVVLQVAGSTGTEAFNFANGSSIDEIATAVNLVSDATGVSAEVSNDLAAADQAGSITLSSFGLDNDIILTADTAGATAGDLNVKFVKGRAGVDGVGGTHDGLSLNYTPPADGTQGTVEVVLETREYVRSSGTITVGPDDDFTLTANVAGTEFDGVTIRITDVADATESITYDHANKEIVVDANSTGSLDTDYLVGLINGDAVVGALFTATGSGDDDALTATTLTGTTAGGVDGGDVISTAAEVRDLLNTANGSGGIGDDFTAALAPGNDGTAAVRAFDQFILAGSVANDNRLQFLGQSASPNVRIIANGNSTPLGLDLTSEPAQLGNASAVFGKGTVADGSFQITAKNQGGLYDNTKVVIVDDTTESVAYDIEQNILTLTLDLSVAGKTASEAVDLLNGDSFVSSFFEAAIVDGDGSANLATSIANTPATAGTLSGGLVDPGTLIINLATDANGNVTTTAAELVAFFDDNANSQALIKSGVSVSLAEGLGAGLVTSGDFAFETNGLTVTDSNATDDTRAANGADAQLTISAVQKGAAFDGVKVEFVGGATQGSETFSYDDVSKTLTIGIDVGATTANDVAAAFIGSGLEGTFDISATAGLGQGTAVVTTTDSATLSGGTTTTGSTEGAALLGNLDAGDPLGPRVLNFNTTAFGSDSFVSIKALSGTFATTDSTGATSGRSEGTNVNARINGIQAVGKGLEATLNTASLDLSFSLDSSVTDGDAFTFNITGGGALFQLGPDVVSNQQARLGIQSVSTALLGGVSGRLFELRSGGAKALNSDAGGAARVVDEVISTVTQLRGRLGAFQRTTLETNIFTLNDTLANLTDAESSIRDADFAAESAKLTRAQILVQSGTSVLSIANSNPQNVLALLR